ncbi:MAG TPA: 2,3-bisphosphoglycerate-independent phosphoglycerate mutase [Thermoanaerobaculia bacterium]|nr:2,3-bisphosphoglycerate-independent phosphoglycerate mutase [Thermoanaerobaculia bacterium]
MDRHQLLRGLARETPTKIVLLVLDGVGGIRTAEQPATALECAATPHLDRLAARSALGRIVPVGTGITPGSGPGHLALFGYDPLAPECDIGRGVLEALGLGLELREGTVAARGNFATVDADGNLTDRRAGRIPTEEGRRLCALLRDALAADPPPGLEVEVHPGEGYRFVLLLRADDGARLGAGLADSDPQVLGVPPLPLTAENVTAENVTAENDAAAETVRRLEPALATMRSALAGEERANAFLLRGFSRRPDLPTFGELYRLRAGAFAGYPLYRGVASVCGMEVVECGKRVDDLIAAVTERWADFEYLFLHVKQTDMAGEDGDLEAKARVLEEVDRALPRLLDLGPEVLAITGDHSTPAPMRAHSWHAVPLLLHSPVCFVDPCERFDEVAACVGALGTFPAAELMGLLLANAGKLLKFGA